MNAEGVFNKTSAQRNFERVIRRAVKEESAPSQALLRYELEKMNSQEIAHFWRRFVIDRAYSIGISSAPDWRPEPQRLALEDEFVRMHFPRPSEESLSSRRALIDHVLLHITQYIETEGRSRERDRQQPLAQRWIGIVTLVTGFLLCSLELYRASWYQTTVFSATAACGSLWGYNFTRSAIARRMSKTKGD